MDNGNLPAVQQIDATQLPAMLSKLEGALETATTGRDMVGVKDVAAALQRLTDNVNTALDAHYAAGELMIRAYVKLGHWLKSLPRHPGGPRRQGDGKPLTIPELGVKRCDSTRAQRLCMIPPKRLEEYFKERRANRQDLSLHSVMRLYREIVPITPAGPRFKMGAARAAAVRSYRRDPCEATIRSVEANLREGLRRVVPLTGPEVLSALFVRLRAVIDKAEAAAMQDRESAGLAGGKFEDDVTAARPERLHRGHPPPRESLTGCAAAATAGV